MKLTNKKTLIGYTIIALRNSNSHDYTEGEPIVVEREMRKGSEREGYNYVNLRCRRLDGSLGNNIDLRDIRIISGPLERPTAVDDHAPKKVLKGKRDFKKDAFRAIPTISLEDSKIYLSSALRSVLEITTHSRVAFALEPTEGEWFLYKVTNDDGVLVDKKGYVDAPSDQVELNDFFEEETLTVNTKGEYDSDNPDILFYKISKTREDKQSLYFSKTFHKPRRRQQVDKVEREEPVEGLTDFSIPAGKLGVEIETSRATLRDLHKSMEEAISNKYQVIKDPMRAQKQ